MNRSSTRHRTFRSLHGLLGVLMLLFCLCSGALAQPFTVSITGPVTAVGPGSTQSYTVTFNNPSPSAGLSNVQLILSLGSGLELLNPAALGCSGATGAQICNSVPSLAPSASTSIGFDLRMPATISTPPQQSFVIAYSGRANGGGATASGGSLSATVSVARNLSTSGSANPSPVISTGNFTYALSHTLSGPNLSWDGISITLTAPPQVQLGAAIGAGFNCSGGPNQQVCVSAIAALGQVNRSLSVPATVTVVPVSTAALATVSAVGSFLSGGNASIAQTILPPPLDLSLSKTLDSASPAMPGSSIVFRLAVTNLSISGGSVASGVQVVDTLPAGLSFSSASGADWSCSGSPVVNCSYAGTIAAQEISSDLVLTANSAVSVTGTLTNNANLVAAGDSNSSNNSASASVMFTQPQLALQKTGPATARVGETFEYRITVSNPGSGPATNVTVNDELPAGLSLISVVGDSCSGSAPVSCLISSLAAGGSQIVLIRVRANQAGAVLNRATASSGAINVSATASTEVQADVDVEISKTGPAMVKPGDLLNYTLAVNNLGASPATEVQVTDVLPNDLELIAVNAPGWTCGSASPLICTLDSGIAGASSAMPIQIQTRLPATSTVSQLRNTANVSALADGNPGNDSSAVDTVVEAPAEDTADLALSLMPNGSTYPPAGMPEVDFIGSLVNLGPNVSRNVRINAILAESGSTVQLLSVGNVRCEGTATCEIAELGINQSLPVRVQVRINAASTPSVQLRLETSALVLDPVNTNNTAAAISIRGSLTECCDLSLLATGGNRVMLGGETTVNAIVRNFGGQLAGGARLVASLTNLGFVRATGNNCSVTGNTLTCTLGDLAPGGAVNLGLVLTGTRVGNAAVNLSINSAAPDPRPDDNQIELQLTVDGADEEAVNTAVMMLPDPVVQATAPAVADLCTSGSAALQAQCAVFVAAAATGDSAAAVEAVRALLPEEILTQGSSVDQLNQVQFDNVDTRMAELRGGSEGFSVNSLALNSGGRSFALGWLRGLLEDDEEPEIGGAGELISRWGGFLNGSITSGEQSAEGANGVAQDFDAIGVTAGVDYRKSVRWVLGAAVGYNSFESGLADAGKLETRAYTLTAYSSWYATEKLYLDGRISVGRSQLETTRRIIIPNVVNATAMGDTDVSQLSLAAAVGYQLNRGAWNFTPNASVRHVRSNFDAFTETGAGDNSASFASQKSDSTQLSAGMLLSRAISTSRGVLVPQFDVALSHELNDQGFAVDASLVGAPNVRIQTQAEAPDQSFGNAGGGLVFITSNGRQLFLSYRRLFGAAGLERGTFSLGGRFEF